MSSVEPSSRHSARRSSKHSSKAAASSSEKRSSKRSSTRRASGKASTAASTAGRPETTIATRPKLYVADAAPNPRRVQVFLAEAGLEDTVSLYNVDIPGREHDKKEFRKLNPIGRIPVMEIPGQRPISESLAICRYLEATYAPKGQSSLFGDTPYETATIEMWDRRFDMNLLVQGIGRVWYGGNPLKAQEAAAIGMNQTKNTVTYGQGVAIGMMKLAEFELRGTGSPFLVGDRFTSADITLLCCVDFAVGLAGVQYDASKFPSLEAWRERVASRPSVKKHPNPYVGPKFAAVREMIPKHHATLPE